MANRRAPTAVLKDFLPCAALEISNDFLTPVSPANLAERPKSAPLVDARYMEPIEDTEVAG